jgi:signal transduction histidine kinase
MWVQDSGPGISEDERERIFERFTTSSTTAGADGRLGLGLSIVQAIAEAHGGRVAVANNPEGGAIFAMVIPAEGPAQERS